MLTKEQIVALRDETVANMTLAMADLQAPVEITAIETALKGPIVAAFNSVRANEEDKKHLFRKLSLALHPDKLITTNSDFARRFRELTNNDEVLRQIPQQLVLENKDGIADVFQAAMNDPKAFWLLVKKIAEQLDSMKNEHYRYVEPIQSIISTIQSTYMIGIGIAFVVGSIASSMPLYVIKYVEKFALNLITNNKYHETLTNHISREYMAEKARDALSLNNIDTNDMTNNESIARLITFQRAQIAKVLLALFAQIQIEDSATDEEVIELYRQQQGRIELLLPPLPTAKELEDNYRSNLTKDIHGTEHLTLIAQAFIAALTIPLPEEGYAKMASVILRIIQFTLIIPFLVIDAARQLLDLALSAVIAAALAFAVLSSVALLVVTNLPLYLYDGLTMAIDALSTAIKSATAWMNDLCCPEEPEADTQENHQADDGVSCCGLFKGGFFARPNAVPERSLAANEANMEEDDETDAILNQIQRTGFRI